MFSAQEDNILLLAFGGQQKQQGRRGSAMLQAGQHVQNIQQPDNHSAGKQQVCKS